MLTKSATNCNTFLVVSAEIFSRKSQGKTLEENHKALFLNKNKNSGGAFRLHRR
jgi:hypothetical protein